MTEIVFQLGGLDNEDLALLSRDLQCDCASQPPDRSLELPDARFSRVPCDYCRERVVVHLKLIFTQPGFLDLPRQKISLRDVKLFFFAVTRRSEERRVGKGCRSRWSA